MDVISYMDSAGTFALLRPPAIEHLARLGRHRISVLPEDTVGRIRTLHAAYTSEARACTLPVSFFTVLYVPATSIAAFQRAVARWRKAFRAQASRLRGSWARLVGRGWQEEYEKLIVRWQRQANRSGLDEFVSPIKRVFDDLAGRAPRTSALEWTYCSLQASWTGGDLNAALHRFVAEAHATALDVVSARLGDIARRKVAYCEEITSARRYLRVLRSVPLSAWLGWFGFFRDRTAVEALGRLGPAWRALRASPGRRLTAPRAKRRIRRFCWVVENILQELGRAREDGLCRVRIEEAA